MANLARLTVDCRVAPTEDQWIRSSAQRPDARASHYTRLCSSWQPHDEPMTRKRDTYFIRGRRRSRRWRKSREKSLALDHRSEDCQEASGESQHGKLSLMKHGDGNRRDATKVEFSLLDAHGVISLEGEVNLFSAAAVAWYECAARASSELARSKRRLALRVALSVTGYPTGAAAEYGSTGAAISFPVLSLNCDPFLFSWSGSI